MTQQQALVALHERGYAIVGRMQPNEFAAMSDFLSQRLVYVDAHVPETARMRGDALRTRMHPTECFCVPTADAVVAPHLLETALSLTDVAAAYLARDPPVMYSANAFWTRPGPEAVRADIQAYHRDTDDEHFLAMFVYLTDVLDDAGGPQDLEGPDGMVRTIFGPAGTVFLADTSRLHRGRKPTKGERGIAWVRWGISERPAANAWDKIEPIAASALGDRYPADPRLRKSIELLVR